MRIVYNFHSPIISLSFCKFWVIENVIYNPDSKNFLVEVLKFDHIWIIQIFFLCCFYHLSTLFSFEDILFVDLICTKATHCWHTN